MYNKIVESNKNAMIAYGIIAFGFLLLSLFGLFHKGFEYYALVVTAISFTFGSLYLFLMLRGIKTESSSTPETPKLALMFLSNFARFVLLAVAIVLSFIFIRFCPVREPYTFTKTIYLYALISILPTPFAILIFYLRSKYIG